MSGVIISNWEQENTDHYALPISGCIKNSLSVGCFLFSKRTPICVGTQICREPDAVVPHVRFYEGGCLGDWTALLTLDPGNDYSYRDLNNYFLTKITIH